MSSNRLMGRVLASAALLALAACGAGGKQQQQQAAQGPAPVGYVVANEQPVTLTTELPGRTAAFETSDVRPQVNGLITQRLFVEGDLVRQGQPLYHIDPAPYQAQVASARAALTRAQASIASSAALARRYGELVKINAIAKQEFENAQTSAAQARADVAAQQAALRTAQIDLARTTIRAPIGLHDRCAGLGVADRCARHHSAARPHLCRHSGTECRAAEAAPADHEWPVDS